jgi:hypothetical protein
VALRRQLDPLALVPEVPHLLDIAESNLWTTFKRADAAGLAEVLASAKWKAVRTITFTPSRYPAHLTTDEISRIRSVVRGIFDEGWKSTSGWTTDATGKCP